MMHICCCVDFFHSEPKAGTQKLLQILVENSGRINFGLPHDFTVDKQAKGQHIKVLTYWFD